MLKMLITVYHPKCTSKCVWQWLYPLTKPRHVKQHTDSSVLKTVQHQRRLWFWSDLYKCLLWTLEGCSSGEHAEVDSWELKAEEWPADVDKVIFRGPYCHTAVALCWPCCHQQWNTVALDFMHKIHTAHTYTQTRTWKYSRKTTLRLSYIQQKLSSGKQNGHHICLPQWIVFK